MLSPVNWHSLGAYITNELRRVWRELRLTDALMIVATIAIAVATIRYSVYASLQWQAMDRQWQQMIEGGGQTDRLLAKTEGQLAQSRAMVTELNRQAKATNDLAREAKRSADIANEALIRSGRPWLGVVDGSLKAINAPEFSPGPGAGGLQLNVPIALTVKNFGTSPALGVVVDASLFMEEIPDAKQWAERFEQTSERVCAMADLGARQVAPFSKTAWGRYIFPGTAGDYVFKITYSTPTLKPGTAPRVVGCIVYKDQFDAVHHTRFCFRSSDWGQPLGSCPMNQRAD